MGDLPPLPEPFTTLPAGTEVFTVDQMRDYARAALAAAQTPAISTEHGPWLPSKHHYGETYCQRCLCRSVFADKRKCDPHIAAQPAQAEPVACAMLHNSVWKSSPSNGLPYQESNFSCSACGYVGRHDAHPGCKRNFTAPPQPLTLSDQQIDALWISRQSFKPATSWEQVRAFARAVLAAAQEGKP